MNQLMLPLMTLSLAELQEKLDRPDVMSLNEEQLFLVPVCLYPKQLCPGKHQLLNLCLGYLDVYPQKVCSHTIISITWTAPFQTHVQPHGTAQCPCEERTLRFS